MNKQIEKHLNWHSLEAIEVIIPEQRYSFRKVHELSVIFRYWLCIIIILFISLSVCSVRSSIHVYLIIIWMECHEKYRFSRMWYRVGKWMCDMDPLIVCWLCVNMTNSVSAYGNNKIEAIICIMINNNFKKW